MSILMRQINVISRCAGMYRSDKLKETDLRACHHSYIFAICRNPGVSQEELSKNIYINKSNVTRHLAYLEEHGYVERRQSETDKRVLLVYPTQKMIDIHPEIKKIIEDWNALITEDFTFQELEALQLMLDKISDRAKAYVDNKDGIKK